MSTHAPDPKALAIITDHLRDLGLEDVARWVEHPDAVRELLRHSPIEPAEYSGNEWEALCRDCGENVDESRASAHNRKCLVAAAWRALGDPRGQADIERAHEEAIREYERWQDNASWRETLPRALTHGEWKAVATPVQRFRAALPTDELLRRLQSPHYDTRTESDARGMEAVEDEARGAHDDLGRGIIAPGMTVYLGTVPMTGRYLRPIIRNGTIVMTASDTP